MADMETRSAVSEGGTLAGSRKIAVLVAAGAVFGFVIAYAVGLLLDAERLVALGSVGLCVGGLSGAIISRLMDHRVA
jgi:hypothetical protein